MAHVLRVICCTLYTLFDTAISGIGSRERDLSVARSTCKSGKLNEEEGYSVRDLVREKWTGHYAAEIEGRGARVTLETAASWIEPQKREREREREIWAAGQSAKT